MHNVVERLSRRRSLFASLTVAGLCTIVLSSALFAATQQLVTGKRISPVGVNTEVGNLPMNMIKSPNGKFAIISDMGFNQWLSSVDVKTGAIISQVDFGQQPVSNTYGLYHGVAFAPGNGPDYTVYAAMGENQTIAVLNLDKDGNLTLLNTNTFAVKAHDFPSGLAVDNKGNLYVANNDPDTFAQPASIAIYNPAGAEIGRYAFSSSYGGTPNFPLAIATFADGSKTYVGSQRDGAVYVLNTTDPGNITLTATINTGSHPVGLTFNQSQSLLYVANAHSDTISVVATGNDTVVNTLAFKVPELENAIGATPLQTYISQDGSTLYAALADMNAVAIATIAGNNLVLQGYIPVGWYPTAVVADDSNQRLLVTNAKGVKTMNPSPCYKLWEFNDNPCYDLNEMQGTVAALDVPTHDQLVHYTNQVLANNSVALSSTKNLDSIGLKAGGIQHIIYIVKENRTYDQILGDIPQGNGDPSLVLFGESITPSQHALTKRFVLLDNFYDSGEASGDGWPWSTQAMGSEYDLKNLPYNYSGRGRNYDFEGQDNGYPVGGFPAKDPYGNQLSPTFPNGLPPIPDVNVPPSGHIWDAVRAASLSYRNYGFFYTFGVTDVIPDNYPADTGVQPAGKDLSGISDYDFRRYDAAYADSDAPATYGCPYKIATYGHYNMPSRFSEFKREFQEMLAQDPTGSTVPAFMTVRFMHDHTEGYTVGTFTPQAEVADNDYSVGQLVELLSKSPVWQHTAVFVIEDDSQDGPDHVDAHRSTAYVISPYIKQGYVDHHFYTTDSILRTMEMLLDVPPMNQYDAIANPIIEPFDRAPNNNAVFTAVAATKDVMCGQGATTLALSSNPLHKWAVESAKMNFDTPDSVDSAKLNEIIWHAVKGPKVPMPAAVHSVIPAGQDDDDDVKDSKSSHVDSDDKPIRSGISN